MKILLRGHKGYIGAVAGPILQSAGHEVVGLDSDLFAGCEFGKPTVAISEVSKDLCDLTIADLVGFDAVLHFARCQTIRWASSTRGSPTISTIWPRSISQN